MSKKSKNVIVLFSGGLDSTYLLWKNLKEGNRVYPVHITIKSNQKKTVIENNAINKIYDMANGEFYHKLETLKHVYEFDGMDYTNNVMWPQLPIWMLGILGSPLKDVDEIQVGYVMGDDILSYASEIKRIFNSYKPFLHDRCKNIKLTFPLYQTTKDDMVGELPTKYLKSVVFCEDPRNVREVEGDVFHENCERCGSCKRYKYEGLLYRFKGLPRNLDLGGGEVMVRDPNQLSLFGDELTKADFEYDIEAEADIEKAG